jgi:hypothetical protein
MNLIILGSQPVIPAQAGIQLFEKYPRSGSTSSFCPLRGVFILLDSRLRGNDVIGMQEVKP